MFDGLSPSSSPQALGHRTGHDIAHDHLQRDDLHAAAQLVALVERRDVVRRNARLFQIAENDRRNLVIEDALALDGRLLDVVESGGGILVMHQDHIVVVRAENLFRLTLVKHFELFHSLFYFLELLFFRFLQIEVHHDRPVIRRVPEIRQFLRIAHRLGIVVANHFGARHAIVERRRAVDEIDTLFRMSRRLEPAGCCRAITST